LAKRKQKIESINLNRELIVILKANGDFELDWQQTKNELDKKQNQLQKSIYNYFLTNKYDSLLFLGFLDESNYMSESLRFLHTIASTFIKHLIKNPELEILRENIIINIDIEEIKSLIARCPYLNGVEYMNFKWMNKILSELYNVFVHKISSYKGSVAKYFASYNPKLHIVGRVFFHIREGNNEQKPFEFFATYSSIDSSTGKIKQVPLKEALIQYKDKPKLLKELLSTVYSVATESKLINNILKDNKIFNTIELSKEEAYTFLKEIPIYEDMGILCRIPKWWINKKRSSLLEINIKKDNSSYVGFNTLVEFDISLFLGKEKIDEYTLKELINEKEGLSYINGQWVEINHKKFIMVLDAYKKAKKLAKESNISIIEALQFQLEYKNILQLPDEFESIEITNGQWLDNIISKLSSPKEIEEINVGKNFNGQLRSYQKLGLNWLYFMKKLGLGACLADDMGLGKTIQIIALLNYIRETNDEKTLLIIPASLIENWVSELNKFTPDINYYVLHSSKNKNVTTEDKKIISKHELFITTYAMLSKLPWLKAYMWDQLIIDEAQAIKNPTTKQTKEVKSITAAYKVALTGTPIENHLLDLWSLFDFLNKGLLGNSREFNTFIKRLKESEDGYLRLKHVVNPFILRRLKTDENVIADLPDKVEMKSYAILSTKQAILYNELVQDIKEKLNATKDGIKRSGLILSSIIKFKQICNHPSQYMKQNNYIEKDSGKFLRLRAICETIYEKRERVLIFTQFREITTPLKEFLDEVFGHEGLVLHGGTNIAKRGDIVKKFQGHEYVPFIVISIKAGGLGLNLTAANHVIHFDRWWNPAVENQATDRAFRIGQKKNVIVHKFITTGTIEEKIDLMIEGKMKLSDEIITDNQSNQITKMSNEQLMNLFNLSL